jgi:hypothetical protein
MRLQLRHNSRLGAVLRIDLAGAFGLVAGKGWDIVKAIDGLALLSAVLLDEFGQHVVLTRSEHANHGGS